MTDPTPSAPRAGVLSGIRVLDFGRYVAGPYVATLLAEFGADVIRIEREEGSEDRFVIPVTDGGEGAYFLQMSRNKRSIAFDPTSEKGREIVKRLVQSADVVVANMPPAGMKSLGLEYETLKAIKPDIILANVSAFGDSGPWKERPGFDSVGQVMCGSVYITGEVDQPYRAQVNWVDYSTAIYAAFGVLLAIMHRNQTGEGQEVRANLLSTALAVNNAALIEQAITKPNKKAMGNRSPNSAPTDLFRAKDGWLMVHVIGQPLFKRLARLLGEESWIDDPRFKDDASRGAHGEFLSARMQQWCAERTRDGALEELAAAKIPAAPVLSPQEALDHPQVAALHPFAYMPYPTMHGLAPIAKIPIELSRTPGAVTLRPPTVGEHTAEILAELGLPDPASA